MHEKWFKMNVLNTHIIARFSSIMKKLKKISNVKIVNIKIVFMSVYTFQIITLYLSKNDIPEAS